LLDLAVTAAFVVLAVGHTPPALAVRSTAAIRQLYGRDPAVDATASTAPTEMRDESSILLRHRAAQFGLVVFVCAIAAAWPPARAVAVLVSAWSMLSFLAIYALAGAPQGPLRKIAVADLIFLPALALAAAPVIISQGTAGTFAAATVLS